MFGDISKFNNTGDYLSILNGCLLADIIIIFICFYFLNSTQIKIWYSKFGLSAVIADVLILVIGIIIARALYSKIFGDQFNIFKFVLLVLVIQIIHDFAFYFGVIKTLPRGVNDMIDVFKDYAQEVSVGAVIGDSILMVLSVFFASLFANNNNNINIIILIILMYILPYGVHAKYVKQ